MYPNIYNHAIKDNFHKSGHLYTYVTIHITLFCVNDNVYHVEPLLIVVDCRIVIHGLLDDDQFDMDRPTPILHSVSAHGDIFYESK